jgi:WD40 repeat protein
MDGTVKLWNVRDVSLHRTLRGHLLRVKGVAFSPDGKAIFVLDEYLLGPAETLYQIRRLSQS